MLGLSEGNLFVVVVVFVIMFFVIIGFVLGGMSIVLDVLGS